MDFFKFVALMMVYTVGNVGAFVGYIAMVISIYNFELLFAVGLWLLAGILHAIGEVSEERLEKRPIWHFDTPIFLHKQCYVITLQYNCLILISRLAIDRTPS